MHDYLREIYFDFCLKNDMPKHNDAYLSADDYLHGNFQLINTQVYWLKNFVRLWNIIEKTWTEMCEIDHLQAMLDMDHGLANKYWADDKKEGK